MNILSQGILANKTKIPYNESVNVTKNSQRTGVHKMSNKIKRAVALAMALVMVLSLTGCGAEGSLIHFMTEGWDGVVNGVKIWPEEEPTTAPEETPEEESTEAETEVVTEVVTDKEGHTKVVKKTVTKASATNAQGGSQQTATKQQGNTGASNTGSSGGSNSGSGTGTATVPAKTSYTTAEALELYKSAANPIKTMSGVTVTRTREVYTEVGEKNLSGLSGTIIGKAFAPKDDTKQKVLSSQSDIIKSFVVEKQSYVCNLTVNDVKSATVKQSGSNLIVTIYVKDDTTDNQNYSNKAVSATAVADLAATFSSGLVMKCRDVRVTATIDANGRLINLNTYMPGYFTKDDQKFGAAIEQWWTIAY